MAISILSAKTILPSLLLGLVAATPGPLLAQNVGIQTSTGKYQCIEACGGTTPTPYCMVAPPDAKLASALTAVKQRLASQSVSRISSADLMKFFEQTDDPCTRGDTVRANDVWSNKGAACLLSVNVDVFPGAAGVPIRIHIPGELYFTVTQRGEWLTLAPRTTASLLEIRDPDLHNDWGGVIQSVSANARSALFQLPRGCIKIAL